MTSVQEIDFCGRIIGPNRAPLVIAELGINHNGCINVAKEMVDAAARAGVEVLKHQTHIIEDEMSVSAKKVVPGNSSKSIYEIMSDCALNEEDEKSLKDYVESKGMLFLSTPFSREAADRLEGMGVGGFKIGSGECNNLPLLEHIASFGKPIILSTGMNDIAAVEQAVDVMHKYSVQFALLHTTNLYPTPHKLVRLGAMTELMSCFPESVVGLSDHTTDNLACLGAVALGASIVERHFVDHKGRTGPDVVCSMDETECADLIAGTKKMFELRGGTKNLLKEEQITRNFAYSTVVTTSEIKKGDLFTRENVWVKRPGIGDWPAAKLDAVIGKRAINNLPSDYHLKLADVGND